MPNVILARDALLQRLEPKLAQQTFAFIAKLMEDDKAPGLHIEPLKDVADKRIRSGRVNQGDRALLFKYTEGLAEPLYVLAGVYGHDEAYQRAKTMQLKMNPTTEMAFLAEVVDVEPAERTPAAQKAGPSRKRTSYLKQLGYTVHDLTDTFGFSQRDAETIAEFQTEEEWLSFAETRNHTQLDILFSMGARMSIDQICHEVGIALKHDNTPSFDTDLRMADAIRRTRQDFALVDTAESLRKVLEEGDIGAWRIFLHPAQEKYVTMNTAGPFRLTGGAGTGKTVVLLHRARRLASENPSSRIVLTTFTRALSDILRESMKQLDPTIRIADRLGQSGVHITNIDKLANDIRKASGRGFSRLSRATIGREFDELSPEPQGSDRTLWGPAIDAARSVDPELLKSTPTEVLSPEFLETEYIHVVLPQRIVTFAEYAKAKRTGRRLALSRPARAAVWSVIDAYRQRLAKLDQLTFDEMAEVSAAWADEQENALADVVLIDEAQDLAPSRWRLIRSIVKPGPNDIFISEDAHQRIYAHKTVLSHVGINVAGRSQRLTLNYRTTHQNLTTAIDIIRDSQYLGSEDDLATLDGYRSIRIGPRPRFLGSETSQQMEDSVVATIEGWRQEGIPAEAIAVLTPFGVNNVAESLKARGIDTGERGTRGIQVLTMHRAKGLEFSRVVLWNISEGVLPRTTTKNLEKDELESAIAQDRALLYVAATRARDELVITWVRAPSPFLKSLAAS